MVVNISPDTLKTFGELMGAYASAVVPLYGLWLLADKCIQVVLRAVTTGDLEL